MVRFLTEPAAALISVMEFGWDLAAVLGTEADSCSMMYPFFLRYHDEAYAWTTLYSDTSRPFERPKGGKIAVKVINHFGDEVMKVFGV
jgi:hypothetical protein